MNKMFSDMLKTRSSFKIEREAYCKTRISGNRQICKDGDQEDEGFKGTEVWIKINKELVRQNLIALK